MDNKPEMLPICLVLITQRAHLQITQEIPKVTIHLIEVKSKTIYLLKQRMIAG